MDELEFIRNVSKSINISAICRKYNIDKGNLYNNRLSKEKLHLVYVEVCNILKNLTSEI